MEMLKTIVCPMDFASDSYVALVAAGEFARANRAVLYVVHVLTPSSDMAQERQRRESTRALHRLWRAVDRCLSTGVAAVPVIARGDVADEITDLTQALDADMVVMSTHARRGWERYRLGSVADEVAHRVDCPVFALRVVRRPEDASLLDTCLNIQEIHLN